MTISKFFTLTTILFAAFSFVSCSSDDDDDEIEKEIVVENSEYVDLGLPSGTLWATHNVGANKPEEYGGYFAWGETKPKSTEMYTKEWTDWNDYKWAKKGSSSSDPYKVTKYCMNSEYGIVDNKMELDPEDDAATVNCGSNWCMPSMEQMEELLNPDYTTTQWTALNDVNGLLVTSKKNGKSLFLPAAGALTVYWPDESIGKNGLYWTRSLCSDLSIPAYNVLISDEGIVWSGRQRSFALSVRPVRAKK